MAKGKNKKYNTDTEMRKIGPNIQEVPGEVIGKPKSTVAESERMREGRRQENLRVRACEARSPSSTSAPPPTGLSFLVCKMGITVVFESESCSVVSDSLWLHGL